MKKLIPLSLIICSSLFSQEIKLKDSNNTTLTVYNNTAMINEKKFFNISEQNNTIIYNNIPSSIIFESIQPLFSKKTKLYSQTFKFDTLSLNKLLEINIGKEIKYKKYISDIDYITKEGKLLSLNPVLIKTEEGIVSDINKKDIIFSNIPKNLILTPSLVWNTENSLGNQDIELNYLTNGINWKADYNLLLSKDSNSLNSWITISNNSGVNYKDVNINIIAGKVNQQKHIPRHNRYQMESLAMSKSFDTPDIKEERFSGMYFYKIPFKESIMNKQKTQINFLNKEKIKVTEKPLFKTNILTNKINHEIKESANKILSLENTDKNNLGIALPKGTVRVYEKKDNKNLFIGASNINNTPKNKTIELNIGKYFDITSTKKQTNYISKRNYKRVSYENKIENETNTIQLITIFENSTEGNKIKNINNCINNCSLKEENNSFQYNILLKPHSSFTLKTDYEFFH